MAERPAAPKEPEPSLADAGLDRVELFQGLSKKSVAAVVNGHRPLWVDRGQVLLAQGDYSGELFVVLEGLLSAWRTDEAGAIVRLDRVRPGEWLGEGSALSNQPSMATYEAETECAVVCLDAAVFKELYQREKRFQATIDARYRERSLAAHLRVVPLFRLLSESALGALRERVEFLTVKEGAILAEEGAVADAVYLVRSGAVKWTTRTADGAEHVLGYAADNSSFGERALDGREARWPGTYAAMTRTDLVRVPRAVIEELLDANTRSTLQTAARLQTEQEERGLPGVRVLRASSRAGAEPTSDEIEIMVASQSVKGGHALVIDMQKCVRCNACVESCASVHADRVPRLSKKGNRISSQQTLASACYHCEIPSCMLACSFGAIRRDLRGSIDFVQDNCVGCTSCVSACPYDVIRMTGFQELDAAQEPSRLARIPLLGKLFQPREPLRPARAPASAADSVRKQFNTLAGKELDVAGKAIKCDLCAGLPFEACVYNCPCSAILRVEPERLFREEGR